MMGHDDALNPEQREAVETLDGPVLVIAGAGSGKTRTLVHRVARLVEAGVEPKRILLLTFTRKAAENMLSRASELMGPACEKVAGGTFHGFAHGMLRRYASLAGYPRGFTILDRADVQDVFHLLARNLGLSGPGRRFPSKSALASLASRTANTGGSLDLVLEREYPHLLADLSDLARLFQAYREYKRAGALFDYDDLLTAWRDILRGHAEVRETMGRTFSHIMVDEYQDTNAIQADIVRLMATGHDNVMVVGDDAQSIYSFRGANYRNILDFPKQFPGTRVIKLERNYRSTQPNLDCTNAIIARARESFAKRLVAERKGGRPPVAYPARDEIDQARFVADRIEEFLARGIPPSEIAVLFRMAFHSFQLETELRRKGLGFVKRGGMLLAEAAHIKDLLALLRILVNPLDRISVNRVLSLLEGLGPKGVERIYAGMLTAEDPFAALAYMESRASWAGEVRALGGLLMELKGSGLTDLAGVLGRLEAWYRPHLERIHVDDHPKRTQELAYLREMALRYDDPSVFLADFSLEPPDGLEETKEGRVVLSTMHSAKGLEWDVVFVISLAEGRFPAPRSVHSPTELEEERRLFYVASTRARDHLFYCYPTVISVSGSGILPSAPSRFLSEIPGPFLVHWKEKEPVVSRGEGLAKTSAQARQARKAGDHATSQGFSVGQRVRHPIFGPGRVSAVMGPEKVRIAFDTAGEKGLNTTVARLSVL